ncbi:hypothetical protein OGAPHI_006891 [Ogataea philodendri]|uniref:Mannosyltransferase n=1 Tax=Ogataea philodendri TaxID=1378263 RepID=A0A9P8SZW8_9ASCO|nr:uncharacterized protein OGAPHI_006891 [Ogataea philodendri]KAH3660305.1 hypothetical protein OGAPHI_006891 [Ogataea philodendri]
MPSLLFILILLISRSLQAFYGILSDCDEVFNYWEPLNLITRLFGKQTWEYSPEYAIRSYAYLLPFTVFNRPLQWLELVASNLVIPPYVQFYLVRLTIALSTAAAEIHLANTLKYISKDLSNWFLIFQAVNPGMSHASISLLPSSFSMILTLVATAAIVNYLKYDRFIFKIQKNINEKLKTVVKSKRSEYDESLKLLNHMYTESMITKKRHFTLAVLATTVGGLLGWPFSLALIVPFAVHVFLTQVTRSGYSQLLMYGALSFASILFVSISVLQIDTLFYRETTFVPLNIVLYNVLHSAETTGPHIFGTEPLIYYVHNLLLNFNFVLPLAVLGLLSPFSFEKFNLRQIKTIQLPILVWCAIFFSQPHKEERFLYPIYPLITLTASFFAAQITHLFGDSYLLAKTFTLLSKLVLFITVVSISVLRIISLDSNYGSPLALFRHLPSSKLDVIENVCIGREWYHYPSSFFLHSNQRLRFVENGFRGMLPGDFAEPATNSWSDLFKSTSAKPTGYNNENKYNPEMVIDFKDCDYYVDLNMPVDTEMGEVQVFDGSSTVSGWELVHCEDFIDTENSHGIDKLVYIPANEITLIGNITTEYYKALDSSAWYQKLKSWTLQKYNLLAIFVDKYLTALKGHPYTQSVVNHEKYAQVSSKVADGYTKLHEKYSQVQLPENTVDFFTNGELHHHQLCLAKRK